VEGRWAEWLLVIQCRNGEALNRDSDGVEGLGGNCRRRDFHRGYQEDVARTGPSIRDSLSTHCHRRTHHIGQWA